MFFHFPSRSSYDWSFRVIFVSLFFIFLFEVGEKIFLFFFFLVYNFFWFDFRRKWINCNQSITLWINSYVVIILLVCRVLIANFWVSRLQRLHTMCLINFLLYCSVYKYYIYLWLFSFSYVHLLSSVLLSCFMFRSFYPCVTYSFSYCFLFTLSFFYFYNYLLY